MPHSRPDAHFLHVVLETAQGRKPAIVNRLATAQDSRARGPSDAAIGHQTTGDDSAAQLEDLFHFRVTDDGLAMFRIEHAGHRFFDLVDQFVNDAVKFDLDAFAFRGAHGVAFDFDVEADDDRVRSARQQHVGLGDRTDAGSESSPDRSSCSRFGRTRRPALRANPARRISKRCAELSCRRPLRADSRAWRVAACSVFRCASPRGVPRSKSWPSVSDSMTRNSSPAFGRPVNPRTFTGVEGPASLIGLPRSSISDFTLPP